MIKPIQQTLMLLPFAGANTLATAIVYAYTDIDPYAIMFSTSLVFIALAVSTMSTTGKKKLSQEHIEKIRASALIREQRKREQKARMEKTRLATAKRRQAKK